MTKKYSAIARLMADFVNTDEYEMLSKECNDETEKAYHTVDAILEAQGVKKSLELDDAITAVEVSGENLGLILGFVYAMRIFQECGTSPLSCLPRKGGASV